MKRFLTLCLLFTLSINCVESSNPFSINDLIDYHQETGYYYIIQSVKIYLGDDVSINVCEELINSNHCEEVVRIYIGNSPNLAPGRKKKITEEEEDHLFEQIESIKIKLAIKKIYHKFGSEGDILILIILNYYDVLIQYMEESEILNMIRTLLLKKERLLINKY